MNDRRTAAIGASRAWYELTYGLQGKRFRTTDDLWIAADPPPPWHSAALTLRRGLTAERVAETLGRDFAASVADSYADLDLSDHGFVILFEATWIHAPAPRSGASRPPHGWSVIDSPAALTDWNERHDYHGVLTEQILGRPDLQVLARTHDGVLTGGAVLHRTGEVVAVSNVWADTEPVRLAGAHDHGGAHLPRPRAGRLRTRPGPD